MHPLIKLLLLLVLTQVIQLAYQMYHTHKMHDTNRLWYWLKFSPLILAVAACCAVLLELLGVRVW